MTGSPEMKRALLSINNQLKGVEEICRASDMIDMHSKFDGCIDLIKQRLTRLVVEKPSDAVRAHLRRNAGHCRSVGSAVVESERSGVGYNLRHRYVQGARVRG